MRIYAAFLIVVQILALDALAINALCKRGYDLHYGKLEEKCCKSKECPKGTRAVICRNEGGDATCIPCAKDEYRDLPHNTIDVTYCRKKTKCHNFAGMIVLMEGDNTQDRVCQCDVKSGYYNVSEDKCHRLECPAGKELTPDGSCHECHPGSYKRVEGYEECKEKSSCGQEGYEFDGNATHNTICNKAPDAPHTSYGTLTEAPPKDSPLKSKEEEGKEDSLIVVVAIVCATVFVVFTFAVVILGIAFRRRRLCFGSSKAHSKERPSETPSGETPDSSLEYNISMPEGSGAADPLLAKPKSQPASEIHPTDLPGVHTSSHRAPDSMERTISTGSLCASTPPNSYLCLPGVVRNEAIGPCSEHDLEEDTALKELYSIDGRHYTPQVSTDSGCDPMVPLESLEMDCEPLEEGEENPDVVYTSKDQETNTPNPLEDGGYESLNGNAHPLAAMHQVINIPGDNNIVVLQHGDRNTQVVKNIPTKPGESHPSCISRQPSYEEPCPRYRSIDPDLVIDGSDHSEPYHNSSDVEYVVVEGPQEPEACMS